ncbi:serine/threonine-protein kinase [Micromonospora sp. CPCC 205711]|uniref:serine/threonine-protein kinase n=1 Tax=Micromonospora sp. CPCC 205547 TaxID=3122400 RepID=UPI002FF0E625
MVQQVTIAGRYRLLELVGRGGMGRVWRARDEMLHREVAVKEVVPPHWLAESERDELRLRTLREARTAAQLNHPNVVRLYDVIQVDDRPWIVMEYVASRSLQTVLDTTGPLDPVRAADIGLALLAALRAAHTAGVLHRDVKPQNVLVAEDGRVMLTDFGLAVFDGGDGLMTRPGMVLGSPQFVAPERAAEGVSSVEADLWSLGATLHASVEGRSPYARSTAMATLAALASSPPDPAPHAGPLRPVLEGLLHRDPRQRVGHDEANRLLETVTRPVPTSEPPTVVLPVARTAVIAPPPPWPGTAKSGGSGTAAGSAPAGSAEPWADGPGGGPGDVRSGRPAAGSEAERERDRQGATGSGVDRERSRQGASGAGSGSDRDDAGRYGLLAWLTSGGRRWALAATALLVAAVAGVGTALAVTRDDRRTTLVIPASGEPWEHPDRHDPDGDGPPPPPGDGGPVTPPPFPCLRREATGTPVTVLPTTTEDGFHPPSGWTWYAGDGYRVAVPVGWLRSRQGTVDCFRDPGSPLTLSVEAATPGTDPVARLRTEEQRQLTAGTLVEYQKLRLGPAGDGGAAWESRWTTPFRERQHALRLLPGGERAGWLIGWSTADQQWDAAQERLTVVRDSLRGRGAEQVSPT